jgi:flavodoxin
MNASLKTLLIVVSYHHGNTEKVARAFAKVLDAQVRSPKQIRPEELQKYDLVGLGSGIYDEKHHTDLLEFADSLPQVIDRSAFIFSTGSMIGGVQDPKFHSILRNKLKSKGYTIIDEFSCKGFNTNSFLRHFGGLNKGRPNAQDLRNAEDFARKLRTKMQA